MSATTPSTNSPQKRIVVYTAIADGYDHLQRPERISDACDYVCFCDDAQRLEPPWQRRRFDVRSDDPVRTAKKPKVLPHAYFPDHEVSIWMDANVVILGDVPGLVERYLRDSPIAMYAHPQDRRCIYDEAEACIRIGKDDTRVIRRQINKYRRLGHPANAGLNACTIIARRHNDPALVVAMEDWWREIQAHSRRDQISFNYAARKHRLNISTIEGNLWASDNPHFRVATHAAATGCRSMLYWAPGGEPLCDERCIFRNCRAGGDRRRVSFDLPIDAAVQHMRFDPVDQPGDLQIFSIRLVENDADGREAAKRWVLATPDAIARQMTLDDLEFRASDSTATFVAPTNDPKLMMDLPEPARPRIGGYLSLVVEMTGLL